MKLEINIDRKMIIIIAIVAIVAVVAVAYMLGYFGKPVVYKSEREASEAVTDISTGVEQIGSIIEDISKRLGG